ncbi:MAG: hypothetical protein FJ106_00975 [Deltaproteobacteria bacterium]|nr:hypothetical protein [Deltaproteobacteria bacterium]
MNIPKIGEILKSRLTGKEYELRRVAENVVVLHSLDELSQILTWKENLNLFYEWKEQKQTSDLF